MKRNLVLIGILMFSILSSITIQGGAAGEESLPQDYPAEMSGDYLELIPNSTTYEDYLQPGDTESYNIRLENDFYLQTRFRVTLENVPEQWYVFLGSGQSTQLVVLEPEQAKTLDLNVKVPTTNTADIIVNVTEEDGTDSWPMTLRIICQEGPIKLEVPSSSYVLDMDYPADIDVTLTNIGERPYNVTMDMDGITVSEERLKDQWSVVFPNRKIVIPPRDSITLKTIVYIPESASMNMQRNARVLATVDNITRPFRSRSIEFKVQTIYNLKGRVAPIGYVEASPSSNIEFNITLENRASDTDWVKVEEYSRPQGWPPLVYEGFDPSNLEFSISSDSERTFVAVLEVPSYAIAGRHSIILRAVGKTNETEISLKVDVDRFDDFEAKHVSGEQSKTYGVKIGNNEVPFKLQNRGNYYDTAELLIMNAPSWSTVTFESVKIGTGEQNKLYDGQGTLNVSGDTGSVYEIQEERDTLSITCGPGQEVVITLNVDVPLDTSLQPESICGIQYKFSQPRIQEQFQVGLKLLLLDLDVIDMDGDSRPDLQISPVKETYQSGDEITFSFGVRNNYPYPPEGVKWKIELIGVELLSGELDQIPPGETFYYNATWESDLTSDGYKATLKLESPDFTNPPEVRTDEEITIESSGKVGDLRLVLLWLFFASLVIIWLVVIYILAQRSINRKKEAEEEEYRKVYGMPSREGLKEGRERKRLPGSKKELPAKKGKKKKGKSRGGDIDDSTEEPKVKKARSLKELDNDEF